MLYTPLPWRVKLAKWHPDSIGSEVRAVRKGESEPRTRSRPTHRAAAPLEPCATRSFFGQPTLLSRNQDLPGPRAGGAARTARAPARRRGPCPAGACAAR